MREFVINLIRSVMVIFVRCYFVYFVLYKYVGFGWCDLVNVNMDWRDKEIWRGKENSWV